jgi:hypothetical protein
VLEERAADLLRGNLARQVDAEDLGAERACDTPYFYCSTLMLALRMMLP